MKIKELAAFIWVLVIGGSYLFLFRKVDGNLFIVLLIASGLVIIARNQATTTNKILDILEGDKE